MPVKSKSFFASVIILCLIYAAQDARTQTGGPGQPEFMQFQQAGTSDLVNPSSGGFSYQIPLFIIGGYPMNLTYQSGILMEDVASMVGLGFNFNAGSIVRTLRGLPDDFNGDKVTKQYSVKPNETYGGKADVDMEIAGLPISVGAGLGVFYNNYKGWGLEPSVRASVSASFKATEGVGGSASLGLGVSINSMNGVDRYISPSVGLKLGSGNDKMAINLGKTWSVNSNEGAKESINGGLSYARYQSTSSNGISRDDQGKGHKVSQSSTDQSGSVTLGISKVSYLNNSFQPDVEYPFENISGTFSGTIGGDLYYVDPSLRTNGYFSIQRLTTTSQDFRAYGIMYEADLGGKVMTDFSTEKKLPYFIGQSKILPIPYKTPDIFSLNAQGLAMSFSVTKNDIGVVGDADAIIPSNGYQAGAEVNLGQIVKAGGNFGTTLAYQMSQKWNGALVPFFANPFRLPQAGAKSTLYQHLAFKNHGELNAMNQTLFDKLGGYSATKFEVGSESTLWFNPNQEAILTSANGQAMVVSPTDLYNHEQTVRQSSISYLTAKEAVTMGLDKWIRYYDIDVPQTELTMPRVGQHRQESHLSEMSVMQPDGKKYVFGIPVYNTTQTEYTFAVNASATKDQAKNTVSYTDVDCSKDNRNGTDNLFEATTTNAYATQFLITAVLDPDYRDILNDGITDDDLGGYVRFTYYKDGGVADPYRWRTPMGDHQATYNRGLRSDPNDDKGSFVYGEKELYYVRSIESKNEIAECHYSLRTDARGVDGIHGGTGSGKQLRKLDSVAVFSKRDRTLNGHLATPIKTVHFSYNYSLCVGGENGATGKLTLDSVSFTYEKSRKGRLSPYIFSYGKINANPQANQPAETINPPYDNRDVNKWGYYQENNGYSDQSDASTLSNIDFPYPLQDRAKMSKNAYAWNLTNIRIPGGGELNIEYEPHDYAYIQNKPVGQMFTVTGVSHLPSNTTPPVSAPTYSTISSTNAVFFKLDPPIPPLTNAATAKKQIYDQYIKDIKSSFLYYKFYVKFPNPASSTPLYEYISGYAKINDYGATGDGEHGYVKLDYVMLDDDEGIGSANPIQKTAIQFLRINRNPLIFGGPTSTVGDFGTFIMSIPSLLTQVGAQISAFDQGVVTYCMNNGYCSEIDRGKSFIRLYNPSGFKISGGSRVKAVAINDRWDAMTGNTHESQAYKTTYEYVTKEGSKTISSGVADYEPLVGGDEISLKQPIFYSDVKKSAPDNDYYVETPVEESLFPSPQITYSKVKITSNPDAVSLGYAGTGWTLKEFFTAKDYPVKVGMTQISERRDKSEFSPFQLPFVAIDQQHDFATVSQGYSIETNNMSGQAKANWNYNQLGERISGETFEYFPSNDKLVSIDRFGKISSNKRLGVSPEFTLHGRKSYDFSNTSTFSANFNMSIILIYPIPIIMPLYSSMTEEKQFQSFVLNKVIRRNGILAKRTVYDQSSSVSTENLAFDEVTGEALLTKTTNEFNDSLFTFKYPAWWMHEGMGPAFRNDRLQLSMAQAGSLLQVGDELRSPNSTDRVWVQGISSSLTPQFESDNGVSVTPGSDYQVYNSSKNLLTESAGQVVTWNSNPLGIYDRIKFDKKRVLNASAIEYADLATNYCDTCDRLASVNYKNNFVTGRRGTWHPLRNWFFLTNRTPVAQNNVVSDIRIDGLFAAYKDFWLPLNAGYSWKWFRYPQTWEWKERVDVVDINGETIQSEDRIGRKSSNLIGYDHSLMIAQAQNAAYTEILYDGFEDYDYSFCKQGSRPGAQPVTGSPFFKLNRTNSASGSAEISSESHTGKYSLKILQDVFFTVLSPKDCQGQPIPAGVEPELKDGTTDLSQQAQPVSGQAIDTPVPSTPPAQLDTNCTSCIGGFFPYKNKTYLFSCWVKVSHQPPIIDCSDASVDISCPGAATVTLRSSGPVIEDWQRIEGSFATSSSSNQVTVALRKGSSVTYFDDIRIVPEEGTMVSYVYDDISHKLTFVLDENNYFTKNEYNNQGELIRVKRETEKGIITVKEANQALVKK